MNDTELNNLPALSALFQRLDQKPYNSGFHPFDWGVFPDCQILDRAKMELAGLSMAAEDWGFRSNAEGAIGADDWKRAKKLLNIP